MKCAQTTKFAVLLLLVSTLSCRNRLDKQQGIPKVVSDAAARLIGGAMERVEYYYLRESAQTQHAIEPEFLVANAPFKATMGEVDARFLEEVADAMQSSSYEPDSAKGDTRLGVVFYSVSGEKVLSIFFERSGTQAIINDTTFRVTGDLRKTLFARIKCLTQ